MSFWAPTAHPPSRWLIGLYTLACALRLAPAARIGHVLSLKEAGDNDNSTMAANSSALAVNKTRMYALAAVETEVDVSAIGRASLVASDGRSRHAASNPTKKASSGSLLAKLSLTQKSSGNPMKTIGKLANQESLKHHWKFMQHGAQQQAEYGVKTWKLVMLFLEQSVPWGNGPRTAKLVLALMCFVLLLGPFILYSIAFGSLKLLLREVFDNSPAATRIVQCVAMPMKVLSALLCMNLVCETISDAIKGNYPLLSDFHWVLHILLLLFAAFAFLRVLGQLDSIIQEMALDRISNPAYLKRKEFMHELTQGSAYVGGTGVEHEHGYYLFRYIWRPFYIVTVAVTVLFCLCVMSGASINGLILATAYFFIMVLLSIFGARTMGPEIYGSVILFLEQPFVEGDIITLDKLQSAGGMKTDIISAVVTGFVERIGLRSTIVRRFDMRAVWVPNSYFIKYAVANWKRPRKLIYFQLRLSHRSPPEVAKAFQEKVMYILRNHDGVDQKQYIKAVFQKLDFGMEFVVICFNAPGSSKQKVQQDIILRIVDLARRMDVHMTFNQQSVYVERQEIPDNEYYAGEAEPTPGQKRLQEGSFDFGEVLPKEKNIKAKSQRFAPKGQIVVRLEDVALFGAERKPAEGTEEKTQTPPSAEEPNQQTCRVAVRFVEVSKDVEEKMETIRDQKDPGSIVQQATADRKKAKSSFLQSRLSILLESESGQKTSHFVENVALTLKSQKNIPRLVELHVLRVDRKWLLGWRNEVVGVAFAEVQSLAQVTSNPSEIPLWSLEGHHIGNISIQVFLPEASAKAKKDGESKLEEKKGQTKAVTPKRMRKAAKDVDYMIRATQSMRPMRLDGQELADKGNGDGDSDMGEGERNDDDDLAGGDSAPDPEDGRYSPARIANLMQARRATTMRSPGSPILKATQSEPPMPRVDSGDAVAGSRSLGRRTSDWD